MATSDQVQSLYIAYFGRPADSEGLKYWTADTETPLTEIADGFAATDEYKAATAGQSVAQIVNGFYLNLFNRNAEVEGLNFWLNEIALGKASTQDVGVVIGQEAVKASPANSDTDCINNKFTAANQWTTDTAASTEGIIAYSGTEGIAAGMAYMSSWGATAPTEAESQAAVDSLISENSTGDTLDLTVFRDIAESTGYTKLSGETVISETTFALNSESQTVNGANGTFTVDDVLADSSTSDSDILNVVLSNTVLTGAVTVGGDEVTVNNIENIKFAVSSLATGAVNDGLVITNAKSITLAGDLDNGATVDLTAVDTGASTIDVSGATGNDESTVRTQFDVVATTFTGSAINDLVQGSDGADTVNLGGGDNTFSNAGDGADAITNDTAGTLDVIVADDDTVTLTSSVENAVVTSVVSGVNATVNASTSTEVVTFVGGAGDDTFTGGSDNDIIGTGNGENTVNGGVGNDQITGGTGEDTLNGDSGNDVIDGAADVDTIDGGQGNDDITGGGEIDALTGGSGSDTFIYNATNAAAADADTITDFAVGAGGDVFNVQATAAGGIVANLTAAVNTIAGSADNTYIVDSANTGYANFAAAETAVETANGSTLDYVLIFRNTTSGDIEAYADADSNAGGAGVLLASFDADVAATFLTGFVAANVAV